MNESPSSIPTNLHELSKAADNRYKQTPRSAWHEEMMAEMEEFERSGFEDLHALRLDSVQDEDSEELPDRLEKSREVQKPSRWHQAYRLGRNILKLIGRTNEAAKGNDQPAETQSANRSETVPMEALELLRNAESQEELQTLLDNPATPWENATFRSIASHKTVGMVRESLGNEGRRFTGTERAFRTKVIESYGLTTDESEDIWSAWTSFSFLNESKRPDPEKVAELADTISHHFNDMKLLESHMPGSVATLRQEYGIRNFGRYHVQDLMWQLQNPNASGDRHLSATSDHNGFLKDIDETLAIYGDGVERELSKNKIFMEANTVAEAKELLVTTAEERGLIDKLYVHAHGNSEGMEFSEKPGGFMDLGNAGEFIPPTAITRGGEIVMFGCESERLSEIIANSTGTRVIGTGGLVAYARKRRFGMPSFYNDNGERISTRAYNQSPTRSVISRIKPVSK